MFIDLFFDEDLLLSSLSFDSLLLLYLSLISLISKVKVLEEITSKSLITFKIKVLKKYWTSFFLLNSDNKYPHTEDSSKNDSGLLMSSNVLISSFNNNPSTYIKLSSM